GPTIALGLTTIAFAVLVGVPLGTIAASRKGGLLDRGIMAMSVAGFSAPIFVTGYILIYVFAVRLEWFPVQGYTPITQS
ncbi:ABC transporter permease subunit, partial [Acinetobacter baumannii]